MSLWDGLGLNLVHDLTEDLTSAKDLAIETVTDRLLRHTKHYKNPPRTTTLLLYSHR
jgi:hypothetical protein